MQRTQLIAALALVVVAAGLLAGRISGGSEAVVDGSAAETPTTARSNAADQTTADQNAPAKSTADSNAADQTTADQSTVKSTADPNAAAESADGPSTAGSAASSVAAPIDEPERFGRALQFTDLDGWLHTDADNLDDFDGHVRIVQFWTFGCQNCKATLPSLQALYERWHPQGLEILGIHAPEFDYEKDPEAIAAAVESLGVIWPIALDTDKTNFRAWQTGRRFWPRTYVVDQAGEIRFDHIGEGRYDELEATVAYLVENGP